MTIKSLDYRKNGHFTSSKKQRSNLYNTKFSKAIRKYGESLVWEILEENISDITLLKEKERHYVKLYDSYISGYNSTPGGDGAGKHLSDETKKKLSEINLGKKTSNETKAKISIALKGKFSGDKNPRFGVKLSDEQIEAKSKQYVVVFPDDSLYEFFSMRRFCKQHNLPFWHLSSIANDKSKTKSYKGIISFKKENFSIEKLQQIRQEIFDSKSHYQLEDPEGNTYETSSLKKFCEAREDLSYGGFFRILRGEYESYKGWRIKEVQ